MAAAAVELPPVIVEGATLAKPKVQVKKPKPKPEVVDADEAPARRRKAAARASKSKSTGAAAGAVKPDASPSPAASAPEGLAYDAAAGGTASDTALGVSADTLGTAVSVVTRDDLEARQIRQPLEALRSQPGVQVNRAGGPAALAGLRIRGGEANHTLVLVDGIVVNDPTTGDFDFSNLLTDGVERIEVIRGPQSGLYGSNALAGVVNIVTEDGRNRRGVSVAAQSEAGAFGTRDASARIAAGNGAMWFSLGHHWREVDGFDIAPGGREDDPLRFNQFSMRAGAEVVDGLVIDFTFRKLAKRAARDGFDGPDGSLAQGFDDASTFSSDLTTMSLNVRWDSRDGRFTQIVRGSRITSSVVDDDATYFYHSDNEGVTDRFAYLGTYRFATPLLAASRHSITGLVEKQDDRFVALSDFASSLPHERGLIAYAGELRSEFADRLTLTGSLRRDDNDSFADLTTWRMSGSLAMPELGLRPHASIGTGVKLPTMFEQFGFFGFFQPNPLLQPETSRGWDAGIELQLMAGRAVLDVTYFEQNLENKIKTLAFGAVNLPGTSTRDGVEVSARWRIVDGLTVGGAYTWLDARDPDGLQEARRARHFGRLDLDYVFADGRARVNLAALYNGRARDDGLRVTQHDTFGFPFFATETVFIDDYWLLRVAGSYEIAPGLEAFGRVENLLDADYQEVFGYETAGLAAYAGLRLKLEAAAAPIESWK